MKPKKVFHSIPSVSASLTPTKAARRCVRLQTMATITTSLVLLRWQLMSAILMFLASSLNIKFRKSDYIGLAIVSSGLGVVAACWFATGLLGITLIDVATIWHNIESIMIEVASHAPPEWPVVIT